LMTKTFSAWEVGKREKQADMLTHLPNCVERLCAGNVVDIEGCPLPQLAVLRS
jgi:hypothetical protein